MTKSKVCITVCDGATGHSVVEHLMTHGDYKSQIESVCAMAIQPQACSDLSKFAKIVPANLEDPNSMVANMKECDTIYIIPPARGDKRKLTLNIIEAVKKANVKNILFLSTAGIDMADPQRHSRLTEFAEMESLLMKCVCEPSQCPHKHVIIRAGFYMQNLILYQKQVQEESRLPIPMGTKGRFAPVDLADVSRTAAIILSQLVKGDNPDIVGQLIELSGPELLTGQQLAKKASEAVGSTIEFSNISQDEAKKILQHSPDVDPSEMELLLEMYDLAEQGKLARLTTLAYKALTGEKPSGVDKFFKDHAHYFKKGGQ